MNRGALAALAYRALLTTHAGGLVTTATTYRKLAEDADPREAGTLLALANAHERLADEMLTALGRESSAEPAIIPSEAPPAIESTEHFECYSVGFCFASVCTTIPRERGDEIAARMEAFAPAGTTNGWRISDDTHFADGVNENGCACAANHAPGARHWLLSC